MPVYSFASPYFELSLNPAQGCWQVSSAFSKLPVLDNLQLRIHYQVGGQRLVSKAAWETEHVPSAEILHGPAQQVRLALQGDAGLRGDITFCLLEAQPLLLWQVHFENKGIKPIIVKHLDMLANARELPGIGKSPAFFSNGWQSWSYTGVYGYQERAKSTRLRPFSGPILHNPGTTRPHKVGVFSSDMSRSLLPIRAKNWGSGSGLSRMMSLPMTITAKPATVC